MIEDHIQTALAQIPTLFQIAFAVVAAASTIAAATPTPKDDGWVAQAYRIIDLLALNFGYAKDRGQVTGGRFIPK